MEKRILSKTIIGLNNICKKISNRYILKNINLDINEKDIMVITGHNGAGKSTLLKILAQLTDASSGTVTYENNNIIKSLGFIFQKPIFLNRSVKNNLVYALSCKAKKQNDSDELILKHLINYNLMHIADVPAEKISSGEQQMISFIRSILLEPKILLLDEPTSNLDNYYTTIINEEILKLSKVMKIIIVSQSYDQIKKFTDEPIIMEDGKII